MSFFSDLKKITTSSIKAVGDGVELIADFAEEAERASSRMVLSTKAMRLERDLERQYSNQVHTTELEKLRRELSALYDQLWDGASEYERVDITEKREKFRALISDASIEELERTVEQKKHYLSHGGYQLPIQEIKALKNLKSSQGQLVKLLDKNGEASRAATLLQELKVIDSKCAALELKRNTLEVERYTDGAEKRRLELRDGKLNGLVQTLYPSGKPKSQIPFHQGCFVQKAKYWREDGSLLCEIEIFDSAAYEHTVWLASGQKVVSFKIKNDSGFMLLWLWDGYFLGRVPIKERRTRRLGFMVVLCFKLGFWLRLIKESRGNNKLTNIHHMDSAISEWASFWDELKGLLKG